jgi:hypothetical protein
MMMNLERVISGFQAGADIGGIRAAVAAGIPTGGWMPRGFLTEEGPQPEYAELYGAKEHESPTYPPRTRQNIEDADATFLFALDLDSPGTQLAYRHAHTVGKPSVVIKYIPGLILPNRPRACAEWLIEHQVKILNVGGNRESKAWGITLWTERYLTAVFRLLREQSP